MVFQEVIQGETLLECNNQRKMLRIPKVAQIVEDGEVQILVEGRVVETLPKVGRGVPIWGQGHH